MLELEIKSKLVNVCFNRGLDFLIASVNLPGDTIRKALLGEAVSEEDKKTIETWVKERVS